MIFTYEGKHELHYFIMKPGSKCRCGAPAKFSVMSVESNILQQCRGCFAKKVGWPKFTLAARVPNDPWYDELWKPKEPNTTKAV